MKITEPDTSVEHGLKPFRQLRAFYQNFHLQWARYRANLLWAIAEEEADEAEKCQHGQPNRS